MISFYKQSFLTNQNSLEMKPHWQMACVLYEPPKKARHLEPTISQLCLVAWPLNESEASVDPVLIETSLLFLC